MISVQFLLIKIDVNPTPGDMWSTYTWFTYTWDGQVSKDQTVGTQLRKKCRLYNHLCFRHSHKKSLRVGREPRG